MTEGDLVRIEQYLNTPSQNAEGFTESVLRVVNEVPGLIAEVRRLRAMRALAVTIPPDPAEAEDEAMAAETVQDIVRDVGK